MSSFPTLQVYDGRNDEIITSTSATDAPRPAEWFNIEQENDSMSLRTYGIIHEINKTSHTVTVCGWVPEKDTEDSRITQMRDTLLHMYQNPPQPSNGPENVYGERVYYYNIDDDGDETFFHHKTPVAPGKYDAVVIEDEPYYAFNSSMGIDEDGTYTMVTVSPISTENDNIPIPVMEARRNLQAQRDKASTDWE